MAEAFRLLQAGKEVTKGTAVAASKKLIGRLTLTPDITWHTPRDDRQSLAEFFRHVAVAQRSSLRYEADATYEQLLDLFLISVKGGVTPTTPGGGTNSRLWTFTPNLTASNVHNAYTIEFGDDIQAFRSKFVMCESWELSFGMNAVVGLTADLFGHFPEKVSFTGAISDPSVNEVVANNMKVYIDDTFADAGNTEKANLVAGGTIRFTTGITPVKHADGSLDFSTISERWRHLELDLDLVVDAGASFITEYDKYAAQAPRAYRVEFTGPNIEGALDRFLRIDVFGHYTGNPEIFGERDGEDIARISLSSFEDSSGNEFSIAVQNDITAV